MSHILWLMILWVRMMTSYIYVDGFIFGARFLNDQSFHRMVKFWNSLKIFLTHGRLISWYWPVERRLKIFWPTFLPFAAMTSNIYLNKRIRKIKKYFWVISNIILKMIKFDLFSEFQPRVTLNDLESNFLKILGDVLIDRQEHHFNK